jgi:multiple sugar transport system permease protein
MFAIPTDLDEAMLIDGYSRIHFLLKVVIPLSFPIVITDFIWTFMWCWKELIFALIVLNDNQLLTMPIGLNTLQGGTIAPWGLVFALSLLYTNTAASDLLLAQKILCYRTDERGD